MIYLISLAAIVAFSGFAPRQIGLQQNNYKNYIWFCGVLIALIAALRTPYTGTPDNFWYTVWYIDLQQYRSFFDYYDLNLSDYDLFSSEAGFYFTMWLFGRVFKDGQTAIIVSSLLITFSTCFFIRRNSKDVPLSLTIYICLGLFAFNMNAMRQAMAMSICLFAYEFAKKQKTIPFVLTVLLAMLFHRTAMCFLPMLFLPRLKNRLSSWLFYIIGLIVCLLFVDRIIEGYYELSGKNYMDFEAADGGGVFVVLLYMGTIVLTLYRTDILHRPGARTAFLATLAGFTAYISRFVGSGILERVSYYYFYFPILLIPEVFQELDDEEYRIIKIIFIFGCVALFSFRIWRGLFNNYTLFFL